MTGMIDVYTIMQNGLNSGNILISLVFLVIYVIFVLLIMSVFAYLFGWIERKLIAKAHYRHGPTYLGKFGILQNLADLIKLIAKEKVAPKTAYPVLFSLAPQLLVALTVFLVLLLPYSPSLQAANIGPGLLAVFVLLGFTPIILFIAAFASGNKYADISAQRSVLLLLSYEIPMMLVIASTVLITNSYNIQALISAQERGWFLFLMPVGFVVFFIALLAELERPPFDLNEADSELIAGWLTDISAPYYALYLFLDYSKVFLGGLLLSILFLGGWLGPSFLPPIAWLIGKAFIVALAVIMIRVTMFRMRIDRILRFGWIWLIPLSLINLVITYILFV